MTRLVARLDRGWYPEFHRNWDDQLFRERIVSHLRPDSDLLDLGAGAGIVPQMNFRGMAAHVCGVDLDPRVVTNLALDEGRIASAEGIPYGSDRFDIVFSDNVLEHLRSPGESSKVARVLRPGGVSCSRHRTSGTTCPRSHA